ncbi:MAG TPA: hypothetical protein VGA08_04125 [Candidatus Saccharimonadales bacterium]
MDNARSTLSRFSGFVLFIIALAIVGALIILTVRSADDDTGVVETDDISEIAQTTTSDDQTAADEPPEDEQAANSNNGTVQDEDLPNTGPESVLLAAIGIAAVSYGSLKLRESKTQLRNSSL